MLERRELLSVSLLLGWLGSLAHAQSGSTTGQTSQIRVVVATPGAPSDSVITVPPDTSWTGSVAVGTKRPAATQDPGDLALWLHTEAVLNGLQSMDLRPWHIVIAYDQFDEDGDKVHSGVVEELWAGPKKYRISYKSDNLNQTDYSTTQGLFRLGDQRWPNRAEIQVRTAVIDPFSYAATLEGFHAKSVERTFGAFSLDCVTLEHGPGAISSPTQYCFDHNGSALRYSRGPEWFQTTYNDNIPFQGSKIAQEVEVTDGGKPYLRLHVKTIEAISNPDEKDFMPPGDAINLQGKRLSGVFPKPLKQTLPEWSTSLRLQHFSVTVEIVIGKDGRVVSAHAVSGPANAYKDAENTVRKWTFQPYLVVGEPAEVETKIELSNN